MQLSRQGNSKKLVRDFEKLGFNAFKDYPWALHYKEFDEYYKDQDCRFILTTRKDEMTWLKSVLYWNIKDDWDLEKRNNLIYTNIFFSQHMTPVGHEKEYVQAYMRHNYEVREYFKDRDDFIEINFENRSTSKDIFDFIEVDAPYDNTPQEKKQNYENFNELYMNAKKRLLKAELDGLKDLFDENTLGDDVVSV